MRDRMDRVNSAMVAVVMLAGVCAQAIDRPNIIFFLADDQRSDVLGCYGNQLIKTPTIDRLAAEGVRFENSFCETPICAASRATIFSGLSQRTHGYNFGEPTVDSKYIAVSYPMVLKTAGYRIGFAGKYGMSFAKPGLKGEFDFFKEINRSPYLHKMADGTLRHETDLCSDAAIEFIKSTPEETPFCMSVSFNATHAEDNDHRPGHHFQWPDSTDGMYEDIEIPAPRLGDEKYFKALPAFMQDVKELGRERWYWRWDTPEKYQTNMRAYYRMLSGIDKAVARVLDELKAKGLHQNTIIIYSADNGLLLGDRGIAGKWNHYEQSLRVPLIVYDPRLPREQRGRALPELVSNLDLAPTFVDLAGEKIPEQYQGRSLVPLMHGTPGSEWRKDIYCEHKFKRYNNWYGVRGKRYKFAVYYAEPGGAYECLFDLEKDPTELVNLAANPECAPIRKQMAERLDHYLKSYPDARAASE
ncbi:MAG: sulfatase [Kiritimatiellae bacterium]|nr:sulfatase [Kiritimatiellia bacterium]